jgi:hypothetical protein
MSKPTYRSAGPVKGDKILEHHSASSTTAGVLIQQGDLKTAA